MLREPYGVLGIEPEKDKRPSHYAIAPVLGMCVWEIAFLLHPLLKQHQGVGNSVKAPGQSVLLSSVIQTFLWTPITEFPWPSSLSDSLRCPVSGLWLLSVSRICVGPGGGLGAAPGSR